MRKRLLALLILPGVLLASSPRQAAGPSKAPHWAYAAPLRPGLPPVQRETWVRTPVDRFILSRLEREGLSPSPEAPRETLLRRLHLDLVGLPPDPADVDAFLADPDPAAYERAVDRLLASPHYGERRAGHWLDLARYADTNGFTADRPRAMWRYRDWVIRAFNDDMPFDRFSVEQLAGDLLPAATDDQIIATGFHRNSPVSDEGGVDAAESRWHSLVERVNTTATLWLGTTLACAQCHDHKHDPFTQRDYYRLLAFFENGFDKEFIRPGVNSLNFPCVIERQPPRDGVTHLRIRGDYEDVGEQLSAATPSTLHPRPAGQPLNRLGLARWLVDPANPLAARVAVNRMWDEHFGRPLVETSEDFGTKGARASHPELLDWLAIEFMSGGWRAKTIHRLIVTSAAYRQSSASPAALRERDPSNRLFARGPRFRLDAETIRDAALAAAGILNRKIGGPSIFPPLPDMTGFVPNNEPAAKWETSPPGERYRRGIYVYRRRTAPYPAFTAFDVPNRESCTVRRARTNTPLQALSALNDPASLSAARGLARRLTRESGPDPASRIARGFRLCVSRAPNPREGGLLLDAWRREREHYADDPAGARELIGEDVPRAELPDLAAWTVVANILLNLDETLTRE